MILIDKNTQLNTIKLTLKEKTISDNPTYEFELFNYYTNVTYTWLDITLSETSDRIDTIIIDLQSEKDSDILEVGQYKYTVYEIIGGERSHIVEVGMCNIKDDQQEVIYTPPSDELDDDYITYTL